MVILVNFWGMSWLAWEWETIKGSVLGAGMGTLSWVLPSEIPPNSQGKEPVKNLMFLEVGGGKKPFWNTSQEFNISKTCSPREKTLPECYLSGRRKISPLKMERLRFNHKIIKCFPSFTNYHYIKGVPE